MIEVYTTLDGATWTLIVTLPGAWPALPDRRRAVR